MKSSAIILFVTIVTVIYSGANYYLISRIIKSLPSGSSLKPLIISLLLLLAATFIAGKVLERVHSGILADVLNVIGGFWLAFMLYGILFILLADIFLLSNKIFSFLTPEKVIRFRQIYMISTLVVTFLLLIVGFINAVSTKTTRYNITIPKSLPEKEMIKVMAVSDIHLGSVIRKRSMIQLSEIIRNEKPDLLLLLGDIVDGEIEPVLRDDLLEYLTFEEEGPEVFAITGNHEFIGGADRTIPYIESKGFRLLKDEVVTSRDGIKIAGRIDRDGARYFGKPRISLKNLASQVDSTDVFFLLDHQPYNLGESVANGVDLHLSGHTHNGQFWPISMLVSSIFELSYGHLKRENTHFVVSSGFGVWGPRVRIGSRSEVVVINLSFKPDHTD